MNNSQIVQENLEEIEDNRLSFLQKKQGELVQLIEAINRVESNEDWKKLRQLLFADVIPNLEKNLKSEGERKKLNLPEIYRIQGQLECARKYLDLGKTVEWKKIELESIKNQISYELNPRDGAL